MIRKIEQYLDERIGKNKRHAYKKTKRRLTNMLFIEFFFGKNNKKKNKTITWGIVKHLMISFNVLSIIINYLFGLHPGVTVFFVVYKIMAKRNVKKVGKNAKRY